jgi:sulfane dehydrogenase subunit SoxC
VTRRTLLANALGAAAVTLASEDAATQERPESAVRFGRLPNERGSRSPAEQPARMPSAISSRTPLQDLHGTLTPADLHFERHHAGVAVIDPRSYQLLVPGIVDRP